LKTSLGGHGRDASVVVQAERFRRFFQVDSRRITSSGSMSGDTRSKVLEDVRPAGSRPRSGANGPCRARNRTAHFRNKWNSISGRGNGNLSVQSEGSWHAGDFDGAWRCIDEAMTLVERTKERWFEVEVHRIAGEIMLKSPEKGRAKAQTFLSARLQLRVHSRPSPWELRAAMSMARLWRDQGKRRGPRASRSVYGWFLKTSTRAI
jgi:hypothetical protein